MMPDSDPEFTTTNPRKARTGRRRNIVQTSGAGKVVMVSDDDNDDEGFDGEYSDDGDPGCLGCIIMPLLLAGFFVACGVAMMAFRWMMRQF